MRTDEFILLPEPEAAGTAAGGGYHISRGVKRHPPHRSLEAFLRLELLRLAALPFEEDDERVADAGEGVGDIGNAGHGERRTVLVEGHRSGPAVMGHEGRIVLVQFL